MGSQKLIAGAVEAEFAELLSQYAGRVDGHWPGEGASAQGAGPQRVGSQVQLKIAAALSEAHETDRGVAALALPQGGVHGGFPGGPGGFAGRRCQGGSLPGRSAV